MALIKLEGVSKRYGPVNALSDITLHVDKGELLAVMGPSGSGKTTLLNIIGCLDKPSEGSVVIDDVDISMLSRRELTRTRRETIGLIFQQFHLIPHLTAVENIMLAQYYHSLPERKEALEALARVGIEQRADHFPSQLSGGEQQRVCVARALINRPTVILADEPTGNLDEDNERLVMDLFAELHSEGHTIILVTHDEAIGRAAGRQFRLAHGRAFSGDHGLAPEVAKTPGKES